MQTGIIEEPNSVDNNESETAKSRSRQQTGSDRRPYYWMLGGSVAFAVMGMLAHGMRTSCDWQVIALLRSTLAFIFAAILTRAAGARFVVFARPILWLRSIAGSISLVCTFFAFSQMPQSEVLTLTNVFPLWIAILCWPLYGKRPTPELMIALACGMAGVVLIQQPRFAEGNLGAIAALVASLATAVAMLGLNRLNDLDPRSIVVHFSGVSALACVACLFLFKRQFTDAWPGAREMLMLLGVGVSATVGQLCLTKAFASGPPTRVALVGLSQIPIAMLFDIVVWGHGFNLITLLGTLLVLGPTARVMSVRRDAADHGRDKEESGPSASVVTRSTGNRSSTARTSFSTTPR
jgi:drug/metabolite transporter (DMT)-like permease